MIELARSQNYAVLADHDYVYLQQREDTAQIGWMYGNAQGALIDRNEKWVAIIGHGIWLIRLPLPYGKTSEEAPFVNKQETLAGKAKVYAEASFVCLMGDARGAINPEVVYETSDLVDTIRLVTDLYDDDAGVYDLNVMTLDVRRRARLMPEPGEDL